MHIFPFKWLSLPWQGWTEDKSQQANSIHRMKERMNLSSEFNVCIVSNNHSFPDALAFQ